VADRTNSIPGIALGRVIAKLRYMPSLPLKLSGKVLIVDDAGCVLLIQRSAASKHNAGKWEFPGGKNDPGEEFETTLHREVAEETGLTIELGRVLGAAESALADRRVAYLFLEGRPSAGEVRLSDEHDAFLWVPRSELPRHDISPQFKAIAALFAAGE
jgi:8-oxo-dGTP diphosphatase